MLNKNLFSFDFNQLHKLWAVEEYDDDHANILKERESNRIKFKVQSPQIEYRTALVNWIKDIAFKKNLDNLSIHLAVYILDIFMDDYNIKIDKLQLIALVTLLLATKYEERDSNILKATEINGLVKNKYLLSEYHDMEIYILKHLNWNMNFTTVVHFVNIYVEFLFSHEEISNLSLEKSISDVSSAVRNIIQIYMDYVMDDLILMHELPSKVAAAIMACTRMNLKMTTIYPPQLLCISRYRLFELKVLIGRLKSGVRHKIVTQ